MRILAIESSGTVASAALWEDGKILGEKRGPFKVTHSETLMPMTAELLEEFKLKSEGINPCAIDYVAVSGGPGSFTGLRIGSATAKALGMVWNVPLVHVPTLDGMAFNFEGSGKIIVPLMDARRGQVYTGVYTFAGEFTILKEAAAMDAGELMEELKRDFPEGRFIFLGDGAAPYAGKIAESGISYEIAGEDKLYQSAASCAVLAAELIKRGKTIPADLEAPEYLRPSQAERVRAEAGA